MKKEFHHIGIPTSKPSANEIYLPSVKLYITDASQSPNRIEWIRAESDCPFPALMKTTAHVAYSVDNLEEALKGQKVIWPAFEPLPGIRVAFIESDGAPVEFLQFS
ncbi:MAG: hypothetical protein WCO56_15805 [Verrucomicrobiota bacterium]